MIRGPMGPHGSRAVTDMRLGKLYSYEMRKDGRLFQAPPSRLLSESCITPSTRTAAARVRGVLRKIPKSFIKDTHPRQA